MIFRAFRTDGVDGEAEGKTDRIVGDGFQHRDNLARIDEAEAAGKDIDAATASPRARQLQIGNVGRLLRITRPDIAEAIIACRLSLKRSRTGDVGGTANIRQEVIHRASDIGG